MAGAENDLAGRSISAPTATRAVAAPMAALALAGALFAIFMLTWPTGSNMARQWASSSSYHHGFFVAPAALWMIAAKSPWPAAGGRLLSFIIAAMGALLWLAGQAASAALLSQIGLVTLAIGAIGGVFSDRALHAWAFPLAFLYFMIPAGESIVPALQIVTARLAVGALSIVGFDVSIEGLLIHTDVGTFAIAEACAGLRLLVAALMLAAIFAYTAFENWTKRIAFILFAAVFSVLANALRAITLIAIPVMTNTKASLGPDHFVIGWLLYLVVLIVLVLIGRRFADRRVAPAPAERRAFLSPGLLAGIVLIAAAAGAYGHFIIHRHIDRTLPASTTLLEARGWRILPPPQNWSASFANPDRIAAATYDQQGERVYVSIAAYAYDREGAEIASGANRAFDGKDWDRAGRLHDVIYLFGTSEAREFDILAGPGGRRLLTISVYWLDDQVFFDPRSVKLEQMKLKLQGRNPPGGVIVFAASYRDGPSEALALLRRYTSDIEHFAEWRRRTDGA